MYLIMETINGNESLRLKDLGLLLFILKGEINYGKENYGVCILSINGVWC